MIIDPDGITEISMGDQIDKLATIDINLDRVKEYRQKIPIADCLRTNIYG